MDVETMVYGADTEARAAAGTDTDGAMECVRKLKSETASHITAYVPVLKALAKRSEFSRVHDAKAFKKLAAMATRTIGELEGVRRKVFGLKKQFGTLTDMELALGKGKSLDAYVPNDRDAGITFAITLDGETQTGELVNSDYGHLRKYCGSASATAPRILDNSQDAFAAMVLQLQCVLGITPEKGMELELARDERHVTDDTSKPMRKAERFTFRFHETSHGGLYAVVSSGTATASVQAHANVIGE